MPGYHAQWRDAMLCLQDLGPHKPSHQQSVMSEKTRIRHLQEQDTQGAYACHCPKPQRDRACSLACGKLYTNDSPAQKAVVETPRNSQCP